MKRAGVIAAGALSFPYIVPATALGKGGVAPSNRIVMGAIGVGSMSFEWLSSVMPPEKVTELQQVRILHAWNVFWGGGLDTTNVATEHDSPFLVA